MRVRNAMAMWETTKLSIFGLQSTSKCDDFVKCFRARGRVHVTEFIEPETAAALYRHLDVEMRWSSFLVSDGRIYEAPPDVRSGYGADEETALLSRGYDAARTSSGYVFDASRRISRDEAASGTPDSMLSAFVQFANSHEFLEVVRALTGIHEIKHADAQAVCYRLGHFSNVRGTKRMSELDAKCLATYSYNLTPEWKPEWGGLLEFRGREGHIVEGVIPCFNALDVFSFPRGHWVSTVAPFAGGVSYSITGGLFS